MPRWGRAVVLTLVIAVAVVVLFTTVFPWVEQRLENPTLGAEGSRPDTVGESPVA